MRPISWEGGWECTTWVKYDMYNCHTGVLLLITVDFFLLYGVYLILSFIVDCFYEAVL